MPPRKNFKNNEFPDLEKPYRRGLILGLSLAEIFLLLVFLLLLVAVGYAGIVEQEKKKNKEALEIGKNLKEKFPTVSQKDFDELFIILQKTLIEKDKLSSQLQSLVNKVDRLEKENEELKKSGEDPKRLKELLSKKNLKIQNLENEINDLEDKLESITNKVNALKIENSTLKAELKKLKEEIEKLNKLIDKNLVSEIQKLKDKMKAMREENDKLKGRVKILTDESEKDKKIKGVLLDLVGDGTLKIACWNKFDDTLGRLRSLNIFDILITNQGIVIHNRGGDKFLNQDEVDRRKKLIPLSRIQFNKVLSVTEFLFQTEPMYKHGKNKKGYFSDKLNQYVDIPCIYNVQVFDQTTNDSIRRKLIENGLDQRFNLFKVRDEKWPH